MDILETTMRELGGYLPRIVGAVVVLVLGWILAWAISAVVSGGLRRINLDEHMERGIGGSYRTEFWITRGVFWLIMLLVVIAFFSVLKLLPVSESLRGVLDKVLAFLPRLLAAVILFLVALAIASALKFVVIKTLQMARFDERVGYKAAAGIEEYKILPSKALAGSVYWLIFLLFLPSIFSALAMEGTLRPVEEMVAKIVAFLSNIFAAALILFVGWLLARILYQLVTNILETAGIGRFTEKVGLSQVMKSFSLSKLLGLVVYILVLIPIVIAALNAIQLEGVTRPASMMLEKILSAVPVIFAAIVVVAIAYVVGRLLGRLAANLLETVNFNALPAKLGLGNATAEAGWTPSEIVGYLIVVAVVLFALVSAFNLLGFGGMAQLISDLLLFLGHILVGLVIFGFGLYFAALAANIISSRQITQAQLLAAVARIAILLLAGAMALRQMGLANEIINIAFGLLLGAVAVAAAIAFGVGGRDMAAHKLDEWAKPTEPKRH